jgi:hypothetical protein
MITFIRNSILFFFHRCLWLAIIFTHYKFSMYNENCWLSKGKLSIFAIINSKNKKVINNWKYIFSYSMENTRLMDMSHDHTDFGPQIPFLGSEG